MATSSHVTGLGEYVLVEWVEDMSLSVEMVKQVHTKDRPILDRVYAIEFREANGKMSIYQGKILRIGDKKSLLHHLEEATGASSPEVPAKRPRKTPKHLQSFFVNDASKGATRQSPRKGKKKVSSSDQMARKILEGSVELSEFSPLPDSEDLFDDTELLDFEFKDKLRKLEEENKALKEQLDIQDTVKQLKKIVRKLTAVPSLDASIPPERGEDAAIIEERESFEHLRYKPSDAGVVEIVKGSSVYLTKSELMAAMTSKTDTTMARNLMCRVFQQKAMLECSVKGKRSRGKGKTETKPPLNPRGVNAIITCVLNKFKKGTDRAPVLVAAMGTRLSELRADATSAPAKEEDEEETQLLILSDPEEHPAETK